MRTLKLWIASLLVGTSLVLGEMPDLKSALENDIVDKALSNTALADSDCNKGKELVTALKNIVMQRQEKIQYQLMVSFMVPKALKDCSVTDQENFKRAELQRLEEIKPFFIKTSKGWIEAYSALSEYLKGTDEEALLKITDAIRINKDEVLFGALKVELLARRAQFLLKNQGKESTELKSVLQETTALYQTVLKAELPKSLILALTLDYARFSLAMGDQQMSVQNYKNYVSLETKNRGAFLEYAEVLLETEDCAQASLNAQKAVAMKNANDAMGIFLKAKSCEESKGARAIATEDSAPQKAQ